MKEQELADQMVKEMQEAGLSPDDVLRVIALAKDKYEKLKKGEIPERIKTFDDIGAVIGSGLLVK